MHSEEVEVADKASAENFPKGGGDNEKQDRKIAKETENSTIKPFPGGRGGNKKRSKNSEKKHRKIALLNLYLLYLYLA